MMTCADGYSQTIKQGAHIQMVNITDIETDNRILFRLLQLCIDLAVIERLNLFQTVAG